MDPDPDPGGPKTCGSCGSGSGSGSGTLVHNDISGSGADMNENQYGTVSVMVKFGVANKKLS